MFRVFAIKSTAVTNKSYAMLTVYQHYKNSVPIPLLKSLIIRRIYCWKCGQLHENGLNCPVCLALQEPSKLNYFDLLGVDVSYDVDPKVLVPRYHKLQILFHPDKHSNDDALTQKKSEDFSTLVNKAFSTLSDPVDRGLYVLKLNGITIDESTSDQNPELLMLILEYNDEISKIRESDDARKLMRTIEEELQKLNNVASVSFQNRDYDAAKDVIIQMKYLANVLKSLKAKIREMGLDVQTQS